jgi:hypothetical protein
MSCRDTVEWLSEGAELAALKLSLHRAALKRGRHDLDSLLTSYSGFMTSFEKEP